MLKVSIAGVLATALATVVATAGVAAAVGARSSIARRTVVVSTKTLPKLGTVLVDGKGRTLYMFVPDKRRKVTCHKICAAVWPPVELPRDAKVAARGKVRASLLGSDRDSARERVVTYNRWPLYTYVGDTASGQARGQALDLNGGLWYVLAPSGKVIRKKT
jgi:predicted lipoprotein with Yx(FWY)xxD motif